jgi:hypothetical protein
MIDSMDKFSHAEVKFDTLLGIYTNLKSTIQSDESQPNENSQKALILTSLQKYMQTLNDHMEDFAYGENPSDTGSEASEENIYDLSKKATPKREVDFEQAKTETMKNNFMNVEENEPAKSQNDDFWQEEQTVHPLKAKFMEQFDELPRARSLAQIGNTLGFANMIMSDSSVKNEEEGFYLTPEEFSHIVKVLAELMKNEELDPMAVMDTFEHLKTVNVPQGNKPLILLNELTEHMLEVIETEQNDTLQSFYMLLNTYTLELKKQEISKLLAKLNTNNFQEELFSVHFTWFTSQILGNFFFLKDIEPVVPLLVKCLTLEDEGSLKQQVEALFKQTFDSFGFNEAKKFIELLLLKDAKLYSVFFDWCQNQGLAEEVQRPQTATADFYGKKSGKEEQKEKSPMRKSEERYSAKEEIKEEDEQSVFDEEFPISNKVVESRPKTTMGLVSNTEEKPPHDEFELSPSQSENNEDNYEYTKSGVGSTMGDKDSNHPLAQFLTEEKNFTTIESNVDFKTHEAGSLNHPDFNTISEPARTESPRISELKPENLSNRYKAEKESVQKPLKESQVPEEIIMAKIAEERELINREWEYKLDDIKREHKKDLKDLELENRTLAEQADHAESKLHSEVGEMRKLMEKYEKQQREYAEKLEKLENEKKTQGTSEYSSMKEYAEQN